MILSSGGAVAQRIITAGSAITEVVCALGDGDKIIASDKTSLYPAHIQQLPSIGYRGSIQAEGIISLKPTLVIAEKGYVEDQVLQQLQATGIKLLIIDRKLTIASTKEWIAQVALTLGRVAEGKKIVQKIDTDLADARKLLQKAKSTPRVVCVYNRGAANISAAGKETFANILEYAGATNALSIVDGYKPINTEALIAANPDAYVLLESGLQSIGGVEGFLKVPGVAQTNGGRQHHIYAIDGLMLTNFGPRVGEAIKALIHVLHPETKAQ